MEVAMEMEDPWPHPTTIHITRTTIIPMRPVAAVDTRLPSGLVTGTALPVPFRTLPQGLNA